MHSQFRNIRTLSPLIGGIDNYYLHHLPTGRLDAPQNQEHASEGGICNTPRHPINLNVLHRSVLSPETLGTVRGRQQYCLAPLATGWAQPQFSIVSRELRPGTLSFSRRQPQ